MLNWRHERFCWVPRETAGALQGETFDVRALVTYLAKLANPQGVVKLGTDDAYRGITMLCAVHMDERRAFRDVVSAMLLSGCVRFEHGALTLLEYRGWQRSRDPVRRLYVTEPPSFARLGAFPRIYAAELIRTAQPGGVVFQGSVESMAQELAWHTSKTARHDAKVAHRRRLLGSLRALVEEGFLVADSTLRVRNFDTAQAKQERVAKTSDGRLGDVSETSDGRLGDVSETSDGRLGDVSGDASTRKHSTHVAEKAVSPTVPSPPLPSPPKKGGAPVSLPIQGHLFGEAPPAEPAKPRKGKAAPTAVDQPPMADTSAAAMYAIVVGTEALRTITKNPGKLCETLSVAYAHLGRDGLVRCMARAATYAADRRVKYTDGNRYLRNQYEMFSEREGQAVIAAPPTVPLAVPRTDGRHSAHAAPHGGHTHPRVARSEMLVEDRADGSQVFSVDPLGDQRRANEARCAQNG